MFDYLKKYAIFIALLGITFIAAGAINCQRMVVEDANHSVEMVYDYGHVTQLAASEGKTVDEARALFRKEREKERRVRQDGRCQMWPYHVKK